MAMVRVNITDGMKERMNQVMENLGYWGSQSEFIREAISRNIEHFEPLVLKGGK